MTVRQVAEELQLNQQTIRNWLTQGKLRETGVGPRRVRVRRADLDAFLGTRGKRADARRNHERIFAAAKACFTEPGSGRGMEDIAARAGVGVGTLYRNFGGRPALIEAVYRDAVEGLTATAAELAEGLPAPEALSAWLTAYLREYRAKRAMINELRPIFENDAGLVRQSRAQASAALEMVLLPAQDAGVVRGDIAALDLLLLVNAIGNDDGPIQRDSRLLEVLVEGIRAGSA